MSTSTFTRDLHDNFFHLMIQKANTVRIQSKKLDLNFRNLSDEDLEEFYYSWIEYVKKVRISSEFELRTKIISI